MKSIVYVLPMSGLSPEERARRTSVMRRFLPDGFDVEIAAIGGGPLWLDSSADFGSATARAIEQVGAFDPATVGAILIGGALDPGLADARRQARVPVVGPMEATFMLAAAVGKPLSVVTVDEHAVEAARTGVRQTSIKPEVLSIRSMDTPVRTLEGNLDAARSALRRECQQAIQKDGAQAIYLGAMTLPTLGLTEALREELQVPVYDPLRIGLQVAAGIARSFPA
ncbi:MAG: hypothetical protein IT307_02805 [Chloroflexi bacterium]|nr:hypothetical protein [Chloroflexota bacterium]